MQSKKKNVKAKKKPEKEKDMAYLKQELELDEHKVPIEELFQRLSVNPDTVRWCIFLLSWILSHDMLLNIFVLFKGHNVRLTALWVKKKKKKIWFELHID